MPYEGLGSRTQAGVPDLNVNLNPYLPGTGWDVLFSPDILGTNLTQFEVYQISLNGPIGSSVLVTVNSQPWNFVAQGWSNSYDPSQPMILRQTDQVDFLWNVAFTPPPYDDFANIQPVVTLWLRHEIGL